MEEITLSVRREPGELPRSWRARAVGLAHEELDARGLDLRSIRFAATEGGSDAEDETGIVKIVVKGEVRRAS
jgi:pyruvate/2-oxoglutarate dehydrogenase complex dihydrolipoamide dehydrogenase (E3) component